MSKERMSPRQAQERLDKYTDEIWNDDGRKTDGKDHKGKWGSHARADRVKTPRVIKTK